MGLAAAGKRESYEICFIPDDDYERFLKERVGPGWPTRVEGGELAMEGKAVGTHRGYPFYTIGQRSGLGIATGEPMYVTGIDREQNVVHVGPEHALYHHGLTARAANWMKYELLPDGLPVSVRIRYKDAGGMGNAWMVEGSKLKVVFEVPRRAVAPGQSVVLYEGEDLVGGGIIDTVIE